MFCFKRLVPNGVCDRLSDFPFGELKDQGFDYAFLDLDNTIASDRSKEPSEYSFRVINALKEAGFICCLVSNARSARSAGFAKALDIAYVDYAGKPSPKGIFRAIELVGASVEKTAFFGDQIFTDILAANRAGVYSVLVEPYDRREVFYVRLKRLLEYIVRKACRF